MKQNLVLAALTIILGSGVLLVAPATAVDCENNPDETCVMPISYNPEEENGELTEPTDYPEESEDIDQPESPAEVEEGEDDAEEDEEPALWPMYVSFGALGAAVLVFIILNLFGKKK